MVNKRKVLVHNIKFSFPTRCDGTIQEADSAEDLVVDGETYGCVKRFCYLGDIPDGDGGAEFVATARPRTR